VKRRLPPFRMIMIVSIAAASTLIRPGALAESSSDEVAAEKRLQGVRTGLENQRHGGVTELDFR
jgi:hypothetical protein